VLALTALVVNTERASLDEKIYGMLGILGASLFFADGAITPAISVLECRRRVARRSAHRTNSHPADHHCRVDRPLPDPRRHGTGSVGKVFGPVMLGWFAILGVMGTSWISANRAC